MSLTEFLLARIAEDEETARSAVDDVADTLIRFSHPRAYAGDYYADFARRILDGCSGDPKRVLADCEAKRRIVELCSAADMPNPDSLYTRGWITLGYFVHQSLAQSYADHPDFDERWAP